MNYDITERMNSYLACLNDLWMSYYMRSAEDQFDGELFACFCRTARFIIVDMVIYGIPSLNYEDYLNFDMVSDDKFYAPLDIIIIPNSRWKQGAFLYSDEANFLSIDENYKELGPLKLFGFRSLSEKYEIDYLEFVYDSSDFADGVIKISDVSGFTISV